MAGLSNLSDLTIGLAAAGGVVLAGVIAHGAWQARRAGPKRAEAEPALADADGTAPKIEPMFADGPRAFVDTSPGLVDDAPGHDALATEALATDMQAHGAPAADALAAPLLPLRPLRPLRRALPHIDALIDAIATLKLEAPVSGDALLPHLPPSRRAGGKPLLIEGLNAETGEWELPRAGQRYGELQAGVQLANRSGALNEIEYSEFVQKVQGFAEGMANSAALLEIPEFPDMLDVVARARELDAFAGAHDAQLAVHLQARAAAWSLGYLQQHASRHGFVAGALPGRLVLPSAEDGAPPVLTLSFDAQAALSDDPAQAALRDVTLAFDVPQTDPSAAPFTAWQASAQALALGMDAAIVDDNGQPLTPQGFAGIEAELQRLYDALAARDLAAGSAAARRLFS